MVKKLFAIYTYNESGSKNNQGGFASLNLKNKSVRQYQNDEDTERYHVRILESYFKVLPAEAMKNDACYVQPLPQVPLHQCAPWFKATYSCW